MIQTKKTIAAPPSPVPSPQPCSRKRKILIIDDDPLVLVLYRNALVQSGHELISAGNGTDALLLVESTAPDLIFLDVLMPDTTGFAVLEQLRKHHPHHAPVIIITGDLNHYATSRQEAERAGAAGFLTKPFSPAQLLAEVDLHLTKRQ